MSEPVLVLRDLVRSYPQADGELAVLKGVSLSLEAGEIVALVGPSGAGKSTLLHAAGLLERTQSGDVVLDGNSCVDMSERQRTLLRRNRIGFVYQFHHLLPEFTALENVMMPRRLAGASVAEARGRAEELLRELGLGERFSHVPGKLSGGEQQRVALARALANAPGLLLADEPTGNLDQGTADAVFDELLSLVRDNGLAALIATHNAELAGRMDRTLRLVDGRIVD